MEYRFLTELDVECHPKNESLWIVQRPMGYYSDLLKWEVWVPTGFVTDLASVPRVPVLFWFWGGRAHREAVLHDYLYRIDSEPCVSFMDANRVFLEAMKSRRKNIFVRWFMFAGVCFALPQYHQKTVFWKP